jgi:hypothetical protein
MGEDKEDIDWSLTTWEGSRRAQLRRALTLTLRERLEAMEGLAEIARRFQEIRARGGFATPLPGGETLLPGSTIDPSARDDGK